MRCTGRNSEWRWMTRTLAASRDDRVVTISRLLTLRRGEPVEIAIMNRLTGPSTVHFHEIALGSYCGHAAGGSEILSSFTPMLASHDLLVQRVRHSHRRAIEGSFTLARPRR